MIALGVAGHTGSAAASTAQRWTTYTNETANLVFDYPAGIFTVEQDDPTDALKARTLERTDRAGRTFSTPDGKAILQIGTFPNLDRLSVDELRKRAVAASYSDAKIDYKRTTETWYVVSGTRGDETFYERVYFSCDGRRLDLFSMTYPTDDDDVYSGVLEEMSRRIRPILAKVRCPAS